MNQDILRSFIQETLYESRKTQGKRLQALTNSITSDIMRLLRNKSTKMPSEKISRTRYKNFKPATNTREFYELVAGPIPLSMDWKSYLENDEDYEDYSLDTTIYVFIEINRKASHLNVSGGDKDPTGENDLGFTILLEIPLNTPVKQYKDIRDQIANSVRHEIEHITQGSASTQDFLAFNRGSKYFNFIHDPKDAKTAWGKYLLKPEEIPAFVRGEAHNAKNYEQLKVNINNFLSGYLQQKLITKNEKEIVTNTWLDWATNHINIKSFAPT